VTTVSPLLRRLLTIDVGAPSPYPQNDWVMTLFLLSATIYNAKDAALRLVVMLFFCVAPLVILLGRPQLRLSKEARPLVLLSALWVLYFLLWFIKNLKDFVFDFSGPNVEMMTPVLFVTFLYAIPLILNYPPDRLRALLLRYVLLLVPFLFLELGLRYIQEPNCFLNYSCRFEAKTVGYFSTTNALATSLVTVLLSFFAVGALRFRARALLEFILLSSMARSAIVGYIFGLFLRTFGRLRWSTRFAFLTLFATAVGGFLYLDPLRLLGDGSANSKVDFFLSAWDLLFGSDPQAIWFGFGANFSSVVETLGVRGWSPHAPILKAFLYFGVLGVALYLGFIAAVLLTFPQSFIPMAAFLVLGLAGAPIFFPTLLVMFAVLRAFGEDRQPDHSSVVGRRPLEA
jgi:hypothetical protein